MGWQPLTPDTMLSPDTILGPDGWWSADTEGEAEPLALDNDGSVDALDQEPVDALNLEL